MDNDGIIQFTSRGRDDEPIFVKRISISAFQRKRDPNHPAKTYTLVFSGGIKHEVREDSYTVRELVLGNDLSTPEPVDLTGQEDVDLSEDDLGPKPPAGLKLDL